MSENTNTEPNGDEDFPVVDPSKLAWAKNMADRQMLDEARDKTVVELDARATAAETKRDEWRHQTFLMIDVDQPLVDDVDLRLERRRCPACRRREPGLRTAPSAIPPKPIAPVLASLPTELTTAIRTDAEAALAEFHTGRGYELPGLSIVGVGSNAVVQRGKE